ncbi:hypothetical protein OG909_25710 [Streptomyces sp. NBC_01754]|uniref:hypothetical protein n=1 Tax=Streptomyces sp. NBC_01754 TaxID=2975930 RepID=UPI002DDBBA5B|nr:hypothetical protein [Streptomyces sp. NBC_01754]WSC95408.1 hypothetical protein OG909_25710 [Streptomyces sp. NBC_01754]
MPLLFLNEISCGTTCDHARAERAMTELADAVLAVLRADRPGTVLVSKEPITGLQIADGHPIGKWHGNPRNRDAWRRLLQMQSKWPHRTSYPEGEGFYDVEYRHQGRLAEGLGAAHLMDGLGLSLAVDTCWGDARVTLEREQLVDDADATDTTVGGATAGSHIGEVEIRHASSGTHIDGHLRWIADRVELARRGGIDSVAHGAELWERRAALFPRLEFLPRVESQLRNLTPGWVRPAGRRLAELDLAVTSWDPDTDPEGPQWHSHVTGEGETRSREFCVFTDLDGRQRTFGKHGRFTPGHGRVHFRLVPESRTLRVAHVGLKLL